VLGASDAARAAGIAHAEWPGRLERVEATDGAVLLDAAHNPDGAAALARHLRGLALAPEKVALVFGTLADKAWQPMIDDLAGFASRRFYVAPGGAGAPPKVGSGRAPTDPAAIARRKTGEACASVAEAYRHARVAAGKDGLVVIAGSIALIGEARAHLLGLARDPAVAL
jgi:dihydrofolate synthase/folylpolyglutamate synthase